MMPIILMAWVCAVIGCVAVSSWMMVRAHAIDWSEAILGVLMVAGGMLPIVALVLAGRAG